MVEVTPIPIGRRIRDLLAQINQSQRWLADKAGLESSTIARIVSGDRNPVGQTLQDIAPVLGVTLSELVAGTDAADRVKNAEQLISRAHYERAVADVLAYEAKANDLEVRLRQAQQSATEKGTQLRELRVQTEQDVERRQQEVRRLERELDDARRTARNHEDDARRYREGLERAVMDVAALQDKLHALERELGTTKKTGRVAAIFASVAAVASVATYLNTAPTSAEESDDDLDDQDE